MIQVTSLALILIMYVIKAIISSNAMIFSIHISMYIYCIHVCVSVYMHVGSVDCLCLLCLSVKVSIAL